MIERPFNNRIRLIKSSHYDMIVSPNGSYPAVSFRVENYKLVKKKLLLYFRSHYTPLPNYGPNYFEGDITDMIRMFTITIIHTKLTYVTTSRIIPTPITSTPITSTYVTPTPITPTPITPTPITTTPITPTPITTLPTSASSAFLPINPITLTIEPVIHDSTMVLYELNTNILFKPNPKRPGSKCHIRYEKYSKGDTLQKAIELGLTIPDLKFDVEHNYITRKDDNRSFKYTTFVYKLSNGGYNFRGMMALPP
jgi:hypothetical protein